MALATRVSAGWRRQRGHEVGARTWAKIIDSGGFWEGDSGYIYWANYSNTDNSWLELSFSGSYGWIRNDADYIDVKALDPYWEAEYVASYTLLQGAKWGANVDISGNTVLVGAPGQQKVVVYDLGQGENENYRMTVGSSTDYRQDPSYSEILSGLGGREVIALDASHFFAGTPDGGAETGGRSWPYTYTDTASWIKSTAVAPPQS